MTLCTLKGVISVQIAKSRIAVKLWPDVRSQCKALQVHYHLAHKRPDAIMHTSLHWYQCKVCMYDHMLEQAAAVHTVVSMYTVLQECTVL